VKLSTSFSCPRFALNSFIFYVQNVIPSPKFFLLSIFTSFLPSRRNARACARVRSKFGAPDRTNERTNVKVKTEFGLRIQIRSRTDKAQRKHRVHALIKHGTVIRVEPSPGPKNRFQSRRVFSDVFTKRSLEKRNLSYQPVTTAERTNTSDSIRIRTFYGRPLNSAIKRAVTRRPERFIFLFCTVQNADFFITLSPPAFRCRHADDFSSAVKRRARSNGRKQNETDVGKSRKNDLTRLRFGSTDSIR